MDLSKVSLNIYSFGYSAGFIGTSKVHENEEYRVSLELVKKIAIDKGLAGIEFPFDFFFKADVKAGLEFIDSCYRDELNVFLDFENFNTGLITELIPELKKRNINQVRIKMDHLGPVFYGGCRFESERFEESVLTFNNKLADIFPVLEKEEFKVLIENHQDLNSNELATICEKFSPCVGINWDIGNSLSTAETVESFYEVTKSYIGNAHIKDYKILKTEEGFKLVRCPVGAGDFGVEKWIKELANRNITMSIELGAQISREVKFNNPNYFDDYPYSSEEIENIKNYISKNNSEVELKGTLFEANPKDWKDIVSLEKDEVLSSIEFIKERV